ncbi:uncharacterized protein CIMG_11553 [Coccidioides immitis RS]|uniref:Uncharacterized protein n=1 Tax=Coccidioides immitis (strain RS) TaxID=246410 RepID=A0A0D8JY45_COCIM|nr:uncharacterized protein CIMG_11553 [Coccidioides immitis RS]KJF61173.1 hypothetical protein CIMG_11553 [Coccidioides immitis RS]
MTIDSQVAGPLEGIHTKKTATRVPSIITSSKYSGAHGGRFPRCARGSLDKKVWMDGDLFASRSSPIVSWHAPIDQRVSVRRAWRTAKTQPPPQSLDFPIEWRKAEGIIILSDAWPPLSLTL